MISAWFHFLVLLSYCIRKVSNRSFSFLLNVPNKVYFTTWLFPGIAFSD